MIEKNKSQAQRTYDLISTINRVIREGPGDYIIDKGIGCHETSTAKN